MDDQRSRFVDNITPLLIAPFSLALLAYGGWVMLALARGKVLGLGEIQLGCLALAAGGLALVGVMAIMKRGKSKRP